MRKRPKTPPLIIGLVSLAVLLGVGFATYYLNLGRKPKVVPLTTRARFDQPASLVYAPKPVLRLRFDERRGRSATAGGIARSLEAIYATPDRVYVVDHPTWHVGARVRWFSRTGELIGSHLAPSGSTLFTASPNGFAYLRAKSGSESEQVVMLDAAGSLEATFTVPLGVNSGGLAFFDNSVYVSAQAGETSLQGASLAVKDVYVPVAIDGRQASDAEAEKGVRDFWRRGDDGKLYRRAISTEGFGAQAVTTQHVERVADGAKLELPATAIPLAVDRKGRLVVGLNPVDIGSSRPLAGLPAVREPYSEIAFVSFDGQTQALNVIDTTLPAFPVRYFSMDGDGYWTLVADDEGVNVEHYQAVAR